ncbi:MAG: HD domain-containing phosphohydrolase [Porticoccus sp.]
MDNKFLDKSSFIRVPANEVKIGMFVAELDRSWLGTPFLTQGFSVTSLTELKKLRELCTHVFVEKQGRSWAGKKDPFARDADRLNTTNPFQRESLETGIFSQQSNEKQSLAFTIGERQPHEFTASIFEEHQSARKIYSESRKMMASLLKQARVENQIDIQLAKKLVTGFVQSILRHPDALLWMTRIKEPKQYLLEHCLHTSIHAVNFGRVLRLNENDMMRLGLHGLLADLGMIKIPLDILYKKEALTDEESAVMKKHPLLGRDLLMKSKDGGRYAGDAVVNHHERFDSKGYPRGLSAKTLPQTSRIISIIDAYDAMVSPRVYAEGKSPLQALQQIYRNRGKQFDGDFALEFIHAMGPYPPGTIVELKNGCVGIVLMSDPKYRQLPQLSVVLNGEKQPQKPGFVDLLALERVGEAQELLIHKVLKQGDYGVDIKNYPVNELLADTTLVT